MIDSAKLREWVRLAKEATPGPWRWRANTTGKTVHLEGHRTNIVLDFIRWGTHRAQPRVNVSGMMREMVPLMGMPAPHNDWDKWDVEHPDPTIIAESREAVPALIEALVEERAWRIWYKEREGCIDCAEAAHCEHKDQSFAGYIAQARRELGLEVSVEPLESRPGGREPVRRTI